MMAIEKYTDISEVPEAPAKQTPAENLRLALELSALAMKLAQKRPTTGIRRYESIEEASRDAEAS